MIQFRVNGIPKPQGSKKPFVIPGKDGAKARAVVTEAGGEEHKAWRQAITDAASRTHSGLELNAPIDGPVMVRMDFFFPRPKNGKTRTRHTVKPDLDKLVRAVLDSLVAGGLLTDDSRVCTIQASKNYVSDAMTPGVLIEVYDETVQEAADAELMKRPRVVL